MVIAERPWPQGARVCLEGNVEEETWEESCLRKFSQCMGLSFAGFEGEFLDLMNRVSLRRNKGKGRGVSGLTNYDWELKKLQWTIKYGGSSKSGAQSRGARGAILFL